MPEVMPFFLPTQLAIMLGTSADDIRQWIENGLLASEFKNGRIRISPNNVAKFLYKHPEEVGRIYCDDLIPVFNEARSAIVDILEQMREDEQNGRVLH